MRVLEDERGGAVDLGLPAAPRAERMVSEATAFLVNRRAARQRGACFLVRPTCAFRPRSSALRFEFPVAAKTGTSQGFHDNWVIG